MSATPGSREAMKQGCRCPVLDNRRGLGAYTDPESGPQFYVRSDCPLHSPTVPPPSPTGETE